MGETATWQSDETIAPGLHMNRQGSGQMDVLDDVAGEKIPNRRITADSFRLLTARLKKKPAAFTQPELEPAPAIFAPLEIIEETEIPAAAAEVESAPPEGPEKQPWAWLAPSDTPEAPVFDALSDSEAADHAADEINPVPQPVPWKELPFEELFAEPAPVEPESEAALADLSEAWVEAEPEAPEPEIAAFQPEPAEAAPEPETSVAEPEPEIVELEVASPEPETFAAEPELEVAELEAISPEPEAVAAEPEPEVVEPEVASPEPEASIAEPEPEVAEPEAAAAASEPEAVIAEPEVASVGPEAASPEPEIAVDAVEPELTSPEPEEALQPDLVASEPEKSEPEPVADSPAHDVEKPAVHAEKPSLRRKVPTASEKLDENFAPVSGMVVPGIGEVAKAIFTTPTASDRTAFLAEIAALLAADAARNKIQADSEVVIVEPASAQKSRVRRVERHDDPFAKLEIESPAPPEIIDESDADAGELARSLLDMMLSNPSAGQPQERALAADALLKLVPRIPLKSLVMVVDRISIMESPPHLLVSKLIHDPRIEVAGPLLELCNHINDQVLSKVIATGQVSLLRLIARRRHISANLSDQLIEFDDPSVLLTLVRNSGAVFSHHAFPRLADHAQRHQALLAPLATRPDLPAPIAFELFWFVPAELRRYLLSRFLTDSETLTKILKITHAMGGGEQGTETRFPDREQIEAFVEFLNAGKFPEASNLLAEITAIQPDSASRIIADSNGEPLTIALKAVGTNRFRFGEIIDMLKASDFGIISSDRSTAELQNIFDSMSFNKARVLLTYWDWAVMKSGPYAPAN